MASIVVTLDVQVDGASIFGRQPLVRRLEADVVEDRTVPLVGDGNSTAFHSLIPHSGYYDTTGVRFALLRVGGATNVQLAGNDETAIPLAANGLLLLLDTAITADSAINVNNPAAVDSAAFHVEVLVAGDSPIETLV